MNPNLARGCAPLDIPVLETERLILRGFTREDSAAMAAMRGHEEVVRYLGGVTDDTLDGAYDVIQRYTGHWSLHGCGKWAVVEKVSGRTVGRTGYLDLPYDWPGLELGWTFVRESWGKGYATESAIAARDWAFDVLKADRVISMIDRQNFASQAVARRVGEREWKTFAMPGGGEPMLWSITRGEWQTLKRPGAA